MTTCWRFGTLERGVPPNKGMNLATAVWQGGAVLASYAQCWTAK
jgi:hypothetical protein